MSEEKKIKASIQKSDKNTELEKVKTEAANNLLGWKKALADYQNLQKDTDKKLSQLNDFVLASTILDLLPIFDNYETALNHVPENQKNEPWVKGLEHTFKLWQNFLRDHNIQKIASIGQNFDPNHHEAVGHVSDKEQPDQIVVQEVQSGYLSNQTVIRPAKVIINNI